MEIFLTIQRSDGYQSFKYEMEDEDATVAMLLERINAEKNVQCTLGESLKLPIRWECGCMQKKCGACAMRINKRPSLACGVRLSELKGGRLLLEPLKKFPQVDDLIVDRSIMMENLKAMRLFLKDNVKVGEGVDDAMEASSCLQCGICLEVCPNFYPGGKFYGMSAMMPSARLLSELYEDERSELKRNYTEHIYNGCGKSLSCRDVCPAGLDVERLLVNSNAAAVWKGSWRKRHERKK